MNDDEQKESTQNRNGRKSRKRKIWMSFKNDGEQKNSSSGCMIYRKKER